MIVCNIYLFGIIYQIFTQTSMVQEQNEQQTKHQILDNGTIFNIILALVCFRALVLGLQSKMVQGTKPFWVRFGLFVIFFFSCWLVREKLIQWGRDTMSRLYHVSPPLEVVMCPTW